ncbi:endonuclease MutS2 [Synergistales bacterium]|nr:endonuclease MutS2 [Synergistales bacterium]
MKIDASAYKSLELSKILGIIKRDCRCDLGASYADLLNPASDMDELAERHSLFKAVEEYRDTKGELPWNNRLSSVIHIMGEAKESGMMSGDELLTVRRLMSASMKMKAALNDARGAWPIFSLLTRDLADFSKETDALSVIDDDGRLRDEASERLRRVRETIRRLREKIRRAGQNILSSPGLSSMLQERVLTLRGGRHAVLVRQEHISNFPGLTIDRSGSGNSVYMEPNQLAPLNNEHVTATEDERAEERRVLYKLTERVMSREGAVLDAELVMGRIDFFYALSEKIRRDRWHLPLLSTGGHFAFYRAHHPLLKDAAVPIDISCGEGARILIITGPNTGGKTVAIKTAAVCAALGWMGCPISAEENSVLGKMDDIYSDIGDEQSIEQNLSTFSAHISQITKILGAAGAGSLILLDELGAGTDPDEGAALGIAILDFLRVRGSLVLATTHHNPIKRYAISEPGVESASVEFDVNTLSPTYRLTVGIPGRSNAILIAEKLGAPAEIIQRAKEALHHREVSMEDIISELHEKRASIERENERLEKTRTETEKLRRSYEAQKRELTEKRDKLIAEADKKAMGIVENAELSAKSLIKTIDAEARGVAQRKLERTRKHFAKIKEQTEKRDEERTDRAREPDGAALAVGGEVVIAGTSSIGILESVSGDKATVLSGAARMELPLKMLRAATGTEKRQEKRSWKERAFELPSQIKITASPPRGVPSSIMVRGMTVDEALPMVERYLDNAYRHGYGEVTVIHGRGEGILRREVHSLCKRTPYISDYRLGEEGEGGYGVTIVRFEK